MLESIGEIAAQQANRADQAQVEQSREAVRQQQVRQAAKRVIEEPEEADQAKAEAKETEEQGRTRYKVHEKRLVIEKYSKDGSLIMQLPPVHNEDA